MTAPDYRQILPGDHVVGSRTARVRLIEYGDFQCGFCKAAAPLVDTILDRHKGDIRFAFRHFPLTQIHSRALATAQAAEAGGHQGRFWEMHHQLYGFEDELSNRNLLEMARKLGLDLDLFARDMLDETVVKKIRAHFLSGVRLGVNGTPGFILDGEVFKGDWLHGGLLQVIESKLHFGSAHF